MCRSQLLGSVGTPYYRHRFVFFLMIFAENDTEGDRFYRGGSVGPKFYIEFENVEKIIYDLTVIFVYKIVILSRVVR